MRDQTRPYGHRTPVPLITVLCQRTPPQTDVREGIRQAVRDHGDQSRGATEVSLQGQAGPLRFDRDRRVPVNIQLDDVRHPKSVIKLHLMLNHDGYLPYFAASPRAKYVM